MNKSEYLENLIKEAMYEMVGEEDNRQQDMSLVNSLLNNRNNAVLWRVFHHETEDSIFENGYSSEYFGDGEGSFHGNGVYSFYEPFGAQKRCGTGGVGDKIMKCVLIGGFKNFLILDGDLAVKYYGDDDIRTQLNHLYEGDSELINAIAQTYRRVKGDFKLHHNATTGYISKALYETFKDRLRKGKIRGVVYNGGNDPHACLTFNPREIIPIAVTDERKLSGRDFRGWHVRLTKSLFDKNQKVLDFYSYGKKLMAEGKIKDFAKIPPVNDCMLVQLKNGRNTMYNVVDDTFVSSFGFDKCFGWEEYSIPTGDGNVKTNYILPVVIARREFYITKNRRNNLYYFYEKKNDFKYIMSLSEYDAKYGGDGGKKIVAENFASIYGDSGVFLNVYHRTDPQSVNGIFDGGFTREYTGKKANAAGPGIYFTFSVDDSNRYLRGFGTSMLCCKLKDGLKNFLIPQGANINGHTFNETIEQQLNRLIPRKFHDEVIARIGNLIRYNGEQSAARVYLALVANQDIRKTNIRGIVYRYGGCWAGVAADWKSVIPYKVSTDDGRTWSVGLNADRANFIKTHGDTQFALNKFIADGIILNTFGTKQNDIEANQQYAYGYIRVVLASNRKISFYSADDDKIISMVGFDKGFAAEEKEVDGEKFIVIPVVINSKTHYIYKEDDGSYGLYNESDVYQLIKTREGRPLTTLDYDREMYNKR